MTQRATRHLGERAQDLPSSGLLFPFDHTVTIALGVAFLLAFIVCGVFVLASPERLSDDR